MKARGHRKKDGRGEYVGTGKKEGYRKEKQGLKCKGVE